MYRADGAEWIHTVVREHAKHAVICLDAFHVVAWAMKALDKVRTRTLAAAGTRDRHLMWAVRNSPADLTSEQTTTLAAVQTTNKTLYRAQGLGKVVN
jgi:transposase